MVLAASTNPRSMQARDERAAGEDAELRRQKISQQAAKDGYAAIDFSATSPSSLIATAQTQIAAVATEVSAGDLCNTKFQPNLISAVSLFMSAITNPTGALLSGLQLLMDDTGFMPPGLGLPKVDIDLGFDLDLPDLNLPDLKLPSFDLKLGLGGGLDVGSLLDSAAGLLQIPAFSGCDVLLPDIGPGAALIHGELPGGIKQGQSGGLVNPAAAMGNKYIKQAFDKAGNPIQIIISKGVNATIPRVPIPTQASPSLKASFDFPEYKGPGLQANDDTVPRSHRTIPELHELPDIFNTVGEGSFIKKIRLVRQGRPVNKEEFPSEKVERLRKEPKIAGWFAGAASDYDRDRRLAEETKVPRGRTLDEMIADGDYTRPTDDAYKKAEREFYENDPDRFLRGLDPIPPHMQEEGYYGDTETPTDPVEEEKVILASDGLPRPTLWANE